MTTIEVQQQPELTLTVEATLSTETIVDLSTTETHSIEKKPSAVFCKICLCGESDEKLLIQPCTCKGSMGHVHLSCLERWLNEYGIGKCELCHFQFSVEERLRYTAGTALLRWFQIPSHQESLRVDVIVMVFLTVVAAFLLFGVFMGHQSISEITGEQEDLAVTIVVLIFITCLLLCYFLIMSMLIKDQFLPWWRWWRNCKVIVLKRDQFILDQVV